ncbi:MAG: hypothetical protein JRD93_02605 [Deltaproteobacteria bacterium]|nr:hypothetical protein [Deltaproteobacteria bacterium]
MAEKIEVQEDIDTGKEQGTIVTISVNIKTPLEDFDQLKEHLEDGHRLLGEYIKKMPPRSKSGVTRRYVLQAGSTSPVY